MTARTPTTEAGRRLLRHDDDATYEEMVDMVLAIENEARAPLVEALEMVRDWQDLMLHEVRAALSREDRL